MPSESQRPRGLLLPRCASLHSCAAPIRTAVSLLRKPPRGLPEVINDGPQISRYVQTTTGIQIKKPHRRESATLVRGRGAPHLRSARAVISEISQKHGLTVRRELRATYNNVRTGYDFESRATSLS